MAAAAALWDLVTGAMFINNCLSKIKIMEFKMFTTSIFRIDSSRLFLKEKAKDLPSLIFDDKHFFIGVNVNSHGGTIPGNLMLLTSKKGKFMFTRNEKDADKFGKKDPVINRFAILGQNEFMEYDLFKSMMIGNLEDLKRVLKYILKGKDANQINEQKETSLITIGALQQKTNELSLLINNHLSDIESQLNDFAVKYFANDKKQRSRMIKSLSIECALLSRLKANFKKNIGEIEKELTIKSNGKVEYYLDGKLAELIYSLSDFERNALDKILKMYRILFTIEHKVLVWPFCGSIIINKFKWLSEINFDEIFEKMTIAYKVLCSDIQKELAKEKTVKLDIWTNAGFDMHNILEKVNAVKKAIDQLVICQTDFLSELLKQRHVPNINMLKVIGSDDNKRLVKRVLNAIDDRTK